MIVNDAVFGTNKKISKRYMDQYSMETKMDASPIWPSKSSKLYLQVLGWTSILPHYYH